MSQVGNLAKKFVGGQAVRVISFKVEKVEKVDF